MDREHQSASGESALASFRNRAATRVLGLAARLANQAGSTAIREVDVLAAVRLVVASDGADAEQRQALRRWLATL